MKSINRPFSDNLGGVLKIWAIPYNAVTISGSTVTVTDSTNVIEIEITPETGLFISESKRDKGGMYYDIEISGIIACSSELNTDNIETLERSRWVVHFEDGNNRFRVAGTPDERLIFEATDETGRDTSDRNQVSFKFTGKTKQKPIYTIQLLNSGGGSN